MVVQTESIDYVESGQDASQVKKDFSVRDDLVGEITDYDGENYVVRFQRG